MTIVRMTREHVDGVARLHCEHLSGLVSTLGARAARAFYTGCTRTGLATGFVAIDDGLVRGFVLGSIEPANMRREVVRRNPVGILVGTISGLIAHPAALGWLWGSARATSLEGFDRSMPELTYLAVAREGRGIGLGRQLVEAFAASLHGAGAVAFDLSVDADNGQAIHFYERLGMRRMGEYDEFNRLHLRYRMDAARSHADGDD
jgi:ribosomal protein S18 acetylase RimI-like enzyme